MLSVPQRHPTPLMLGSLNTVPPHPHLIICSRHRERAQRSGSAGNQGTARRGRPPSSSNTRHVGPAHPPPGRGSALPQPPPMANGAGWWQPPLATGGGQGRLQWRSERMAADVGRPRTPPLTHGAAPAQRGGAEARRAAWRDELSRCGDVTAPPERGARRCLETRRRRGEPKGNGDGSRGRLCPQARHGARIVRGLSAAAPSHRGCAGLDSLISICSLVFYIICMPGVQRWVH